MVGPEADGDRAAILKAEGERLPGRRAETMKEDQAHPNPLPHPSLQPQPHLRSSASPILILIPNEQSSSSDPEPHPHPYPHPSLHHIFLSTNQTSLPVVVELSDEAEELREPGRRVATLPGPDDQAAVTFQAEMVKELRRLIVSLEEEDWRRKR